MQYILLKYNAMLLRIPLGKTACTFYNYNMLFLLYYYSTYRICMQYILLKHNAMLFLLYYYSVFFSLVVVLRETGKGYQDDTLCLVARTGVVPVYMIGILMILISNYILDVILLLKSVKLIKRD